MIAKKLGVARSALDEKLSRSKAARMELKKRPKVEFKPEPKQQIEIAKTEDHLLCLALKQVELRSYLKPIEESMLLRDESKQLLQALKKYAEIDEEQLNRLDNLSDYVKIELLQYEELYQGLELSELRYEAARLQARLIEHYVKRQKQNIALQLTSADDKMTDTLLSEARQLDELLRVNLGDNNA